MLLLDVVGAQQPPARGTHRPSAGDRTEPSGFDAFFREAEPRLRRALVGRYGIERGRDGAAEALAWGFEHWSEVQLMDNPIGYRYRVGTSRSRPKRRVLFPIPTPLGDAPTVEPGLPAALGSLTPNQREAVVLLAGYGCTFDEVAQLTGRSISTVNTHYRRGMTKLRAAIGTDGADR